MITAIIPVLNESETIGQVVEFVQRDPRVTEVLVVDDGSIDGTAEQARASGARVITSTLLGKGASMEDGLFAASNELLLYLDGDLQELRSDLVEAMTEPLVLGQADFVKARFSRAGGRVTTLTARPLLRVFFPELAHFEQPLGGIIAARRSLLRNLRFENDYGVDIGLLLDASAAGARLAEVDIGHIQHDSQPLEVLGDMAAQVVRVLLERASKYGRLRLTHIREVAEVERQMQAELAISLQKMGRAEKLALFDMDGTLLQGRFIETLARRTNRLVELREFLDKDAYSPDERARRIAAVFRGVPKEVFEETARAMPLMPGAVETVVTLRKAGYRVGIVTDSYRVPAEIVRRRVFADFSVSHLMKFSRGKSLGEVKLSPVMEHPHGCAHHLHCKKNVMLHLMEKMGVDSTQVLAIGDGDNDICMLESAGLSVAFQPKSTRVRSAARVVLQDSLKELLDQPGLSLAVAE
ncbi:MAG: haloacid dehalogenase-like hydrolase [Gemmataceae bacterium]